jgi:hypothetical protein
MSDKEKWIKEVAEEINRSVSSLKKAIKDTGMEINSKYDVLLCYAKWSVPKLKDVEKQERWYKTRIENLEQLIYDLQNVTKKDFICKIMIILPNFSVLFFLPVLKYFPDGIARL